MRRISSVAATTGIGAPGTGGGSVVVGGTSAGLAILGQYVYTSQFAQNANLTSAQTVANYFTPSYYQGAPAIASNVLSLSDLGGVITDSHFTERSSYVECKEISGLYDTRNVGRFGRLLSFVGSMLLGPPYGASYCGPLSADGLAVDASTAMVINPDGTAQVYGTGYVYFVNGSAQNVPVSLSGGAPQATLTMTNVYMTWVGPSNGEFQFSTLWQTSTNIPNYGVFSLENGVIEITAGWWPPTINPIILA